MAFREENAETSGCVVKTHRRPPYLEGVRRDIGTPPAINGPKDQRWDYWEISHGDLPWDLHSSDMDIS